MLIKQRQLDKYRLVNMNDTQMTHQSYFHYRDLDFGQISIHLFSVSPWMPKKYYKGNKKTSY